MQARRIKKVSTETAQKIETGKTIGTFSGIVKELVENGIDAGGTRIDVKIRKLGLEGIEVTDNGKGVSEESFEMFGRLHATSKMKDYDDLAKITTYGFRGTAMASICGAGGVTIETKTDEMEIGHRLRYDESGVLVDKAVCQRGCSGTTVIVTDILQSHPVRHAEWARNVKQEYARTQSYLYAYAICNPAIKMASIREDGKVVFSTSGRGGLRECLIELYGIGEVNKLHFFDVSLENKMRCKGAVSKPGSGRATNSQQFCFINRRPVFLPELSKRINKAYREHGFKDCPSVFVDVEAPTESYEVNVTPDKRVVNFAQEENVFLVLQGKLSEIWESLIPAETVRENLFEEKPLLQTPGKAAAWEAVGVRLPEEQPGREEALLGTPVSVDGCEGDEEDELEKAPLFFDEEDPLVITKDRFKDLKIVGQFNRGFIIALLEGDGSRLYAIDQHAADEKRRFEKYMGELRIETQKLVCSKRVEMLADEELFVCENIPRIEKWKFSVFFDEKAPPTQRVCLVGVPVVYKKTLGEGDFKEFVSSIIENADESTDTIPRIRRIVASMACRSSVMIGDAVGRRRMGEIVHGIGRLEKPWTCPHGRPTIRAIGWVGEKELEKEAEK
ncbi:MAG: DNA mismatch repair protein Pms1/Mlh2 [Amphiamblys sp. WSBS2006]|nr:MAG: DNA mismatch repair protein Pms1/Mlh2 [Amphiamblys sp. WSBS2006]